MTLWSRSSKKLSLGGTRAPRQHQRSQKKFAKFHLRKKSVKPWHDRWEMRFETAGFRGPFFKEIHGAHGCHMLNWT